jgi:hypothetical protein
MSSTTLYTIQPDGDLEVAAEYRNSHGFCPSIWTVLVAKYVPDGMPIGGTEHDRFDWIMAGRKTWLMDSDHCFKHMGPASRNGSMVDSDALCYAITLDFAAVARDDLAIIADALDKFCVDHGAPPIGHLSAMASKLRELGSTDIRGVCWNGTSLGDTFAGGIYIEAEDDSRSYNFDVDDKHFWVGTDYLRQEEKAGPGHE